jgi:hypothetical protein
MFMFNDQLEAIQNIPEPLSPRQRGFFSMAM